MTKKLSKEQLEQNCSQCYHPIRYHSTNYNGIFGCWEHLSYDNNDFCRCKHDVNFSRQESSQIYFMLDAIESSPDKLSQILFISENENASFKYCEIIERFRKVKTLKEIFDLARDIRREIK